jgi:putative glutathione S-transferase
LNVDGSLDNAKFPALQLDVIRTGYYWHDRSVNPFGIIAAAPDSDWSAAHGRERFGPARVTLASGQAIEVDPMTLQRGEVVR